MAFQPIQSADLASCLSALDPPCRKRRNVLNCLTVGLTDCYSFIAMQSNPEAHVSPVSNANTVSSSPPHVRSEDTSYVDDAQIGAGAFSVVTRAYNSSGQVFAIKKVLADYLLLAYREIIFLRHLQRKTCRGGDFCKFLVSLILILMWLYVTLQLFGCYYVSSANAPMTVSSCILYIMIPVLHSSSRCRHLQGARGGGAVSGAGHVSVHPSGLHDGQARGAVAG